MPFTRSIEPASVSRKSWQPKSFDGAKPAMQSQASSRETLLRHLAEHDGHLALVVHVLVALGPDQLALVGVERRQRLLEIGRRLGRRERVVELVVARDVVHVNADDLGRRAGRQMHDLVLAAGAAVGEHDAAVLELDPVGAAVLHHMPHFLARTFQNAHLCPSPLPTHVGAQPLDSGRHRLVVDAVETVIVHAPHGSAVVPLGPPPSRVTMSTLGAPVSSALNRSASAGGVTRQASSRWRSSITGTLMLAHVAQDAGAALAAVVAHQHARGDHRRVGPSPPTAW